MESERDLSENIAFALLDSPFSSFPIETKSGSYPPSNGVPFDSVYERSCTESTKWTQYSDVDGAEGAVNLSRPAAPEVAGAHEPLEFVGDGSRVALHKEHAVRVGCMRVLGLGSPRALSGADSGRESDPRLRSR
jgi:hypothetical protein